MPGTGGEDIAAAVAHQVEGEDGQEQGEGEMDRGGGKCLLTGLAEAGTVASYHRSRPARSRSSRSRALRQTG